MAISDGDVWASRPVQRFSSRDGNVLDQGMYDEDMAFCGRDGDGGQLRACIVCGLLETSFSHRDRRKLLMFRPIEREGVSERV